LADPAEVRLEFFLRNDLAAIACVDAFLNICFELLEERVGPALLYKRIVRCGLAPAPSKPSKLSDRRYLPRAASSRPDDCTETCGQRDVFEHLRARTRPYHRDVVCLERAAHPAARRHRFALRAADRVARALADERRAMTSQRADDVSSPTDQAVASARRAMALFAAHEKKTRDGTGAASGSVLSIFRLLQVPPIVNVPMVVRETKL